MKQWIANEQNEQPVQAYFEWKGGSSHTALIVGCTADDDYLLVYDPLKGKHWLRWKTVVDAYGKGSWQRTYCNIRND